MDRRRFIRTCGWYGAAALLGRALAARNLPPRLSRPPLDTPEGGLWAQCDRIEAQLRASPLLVRDEALASYLHGIVCRLAQEHCPDVRTYAVRTPWFNATMAPNGMTQVWSGLLLRCGNEAQLAAVLGHELGHYVMRHSLESLKDVKSRSAWAAVVGVVPIAGLAAVSALAAGGMAFSRDHERAADRIGLEVMAAAGYPPMEASRIWQDLLDELKAEQDWTGDARKQSILFATHPPTEERRKHLEELAAAAGGNDRDPGAGPLRQAIAPHRMGWMEDELKRRRLGESLALFTRLSQAEPEDGLARYFLGEVHRLRGGDEGERLALETYEKAAGLPGAPAEVHRALGRMHRKAGRADAMKQAFARYLELRPDAGDAEMIRSYLKEP
jgi:predicted Zn-dependent protease